MQHKRLEETTGERVYDADTLRQVTALANQLQESHRDALTAEQIEGIGAEVGLGRRFVQEALKQLAHHQSQASGRRERANEFRGLVAGWAVGGLWSLLACLLTATVPAAGNLFTLVSAPLLAVTVGFLIGKQRAAMGAALSLASALALAIGLVPGGGWGAALALLTLGGPLAAWLAWQGARVRKHYFPLAGDTAGVSSPALLEMLVTVQRQLEERAQHRAFLSIEVTGAREMRRDGPGALVDHTFGQFVEWVEALVRDCGGECRGTVEEGMICTFPADSGAVSVARQLQEGMGRFNTERNSLASPFRIRCGITAGGVAEESEPHLDALHSAYIERAVEVQRQADPGDILVSSELAAAALLELRSLAPLSREAGAAPIFSWRAGQRMRQRP